MTAYRVKAYLQHDTKPALIVDSGHAWSEEADACEWLDAEGDFFSETVTIDTKRTDLAGYWLDDVRLVPEGHEDYARDDAYPGGVTHVTHTYTIHLGMAARDDRHAWEVAEQIRTLIDNYVSSIESDWPAADRTFVESPSDYVIDSINVTDTDDWAEHVPVEDICGNCGKTGSTNRIRTGHGTRFCPACGMGPKRQPVYPIEDVMI